MVYKREVVAFDKKEKRMKNEDHNLKNERVSINPIINLEITNHCNLKCSFCLNPRRDFRKKGFMDSNIFERFIEQVSKDSKIIICGIGEPALHPQFLTFISKIKEKANNVSLSTNGANLSSIMIDRMVELGINKIFISLDYFDRDDYRKNKHGSIDDVLANIKLLVEKKEKAEYPQIQVNMLAEKTKEKQIEDAVRYFSTILQQGDCVYTRQIRNLCNVITINRMHSYDCWDGLEKFKIDLTKKGLDTSKFVVENWLKLLSLDNPPEKRTFCRAPFTYFMLLYTGEVVACCNDFNAKLKMGSIERDSIENIWNGDLYNNFRKDMKEMNFTKWQLCKNCEDWYKNP